MSKDEVKCLSKIMKIEMIPSQQAFFTAWRITPRLPLLLSSEGETLMIPCLSIAEIELFKEPERPMQQKNR